MKLAIALSLLGCLVLSSGQQRFPYQQYQSRVIPPWTYLDAFSDADLYSYMLARKFGFPSVPQRNTHLVSCCLVIRIDAIIVFGCALGKKRASRCASGVSFVRQAGRAVRRRTVKKSIWRSPADSTRSTRRRIGRPSFLVQLCDNDRLNKQLLQSVAKDHLLLHDNDGYHHFHYDLHHVHRFCRVVIHKHLSQAPPNDGVSPCDGRCPRTGKAF